MYPVHVPDHRLQTLGWVDAEILDAAVRSLSAHAADLDREHAVHALDSLDELALHEVLARGFLASGFGVHREVPYPAQSVSKRGRRRAARSERSRCDLVLTPGVHDELADPVRELVESDSLDGTLFAHAPTQRSHAVRPEDAFWLEVKLVGQNAYSCGVPGPNRSYSSELLASLADARKLADDSSIARGASLIVLFTETPETASHDLLMAAHRGLDRGIPLSSPLVEHFSIRDRIGNHSCSVALFPVRAR